MTISPSVTSTSSLGLPSNEGKKPKEEVDSSATDLMKPNAIIIAVTVVGVLAFAVTTGIIFIVVARKRKINKEEPEKIYPVTTQPVDMSSNQQAVNRGGIVEDSEAQLSSAPDYLSNQVVLVPPQHCLTQTETVISRMHGYCGSDSVSTFQKFQAEERWKVEEEERKREGNANQQFTHRAQSRNSGESREVEEAVGGSFGSTDGKLKVLREDYSRIHLVDEEHRQRTKWEDKLTIRSVSDESVYSRLPDGSLDPDFPKLYQEQKKRRHSDGDFISMWNTTQHKSFNSLKLDDTAMPKPLDIFKQHLKCMFSTTFQFLDNANCSLFEDSPAQSIRSDYTDVKADELHLIPHDLDAPFLSTDTGTSKVVAKSKTSRSNSYSKEVASIELFDHETYTQKALTSTFKPGRRSDDQIHRASNMEQLEVLRSLTTEYNYSRSRLHDSDESDEEVRTHNRQMAFNTLNTAATVQMRPCGNRTIKENAVLGSWTDEFHGR